MTKRIVALILTGAMLIPHGVYAYTDIPDGYVQEESADGEAVVFKGSDEVQAKASKLVSSPEVLNDSGENTAKFTGAAGTATFQNVPKTLKYKYDTLNIRIYSKKATGDTLFVLVNSPKTSGLNYYKFTTSVDWEGWKEFDIRVDTLATVRSPSTENLSHVTMSFTYDECVPSPETVLYIDTIKFVCRLDSTKSGGYSAVVFPVELAEEFYTLSENTLCYYNYRKYVYLDKKHCDIDNRETTAVSVDGVSMMPASFFKDYIGAEVKVNASDVVIKKGGKTVSAAIGSKRYSVDGETKELSAEPFKSKSVIMLPVGDIIGEFGQKLVSVGNINFVDPDEKLINRINDSKEFYNLAKFKIAHADYAVESVKDGDFAEAVKNYRSALIGNDNDMTNPFIAEKVKAIEEAGRKSWESMDKTAANGVMWGEKTEGQSNFISAQFSNISNMCKAYACVGSGLYKNKELFSDIVFALDFASNDFYGPAARKQSNRYGNWWYWMIGGPTQLINALMCIGDELTDEQIDDYLATIDAIMPVVRYTGGNMAWSVYIVMGAGVLQHDAEKVLRAAERLSEFWTWGSGTDDGVYYDGTIIQHHYYPYNGGYGANLINDLSNSVMALANTTLFPTDPNIETQVEWVKKCFVPVIYNGHTMQSFTGRNWRSLQAQAVSRLQRLYPVCCRCFTMLIPRTRRI